MRLPACAAVVLALAARTAPAEDRPAYRVLARDRGHVAIVNAKGEVEWEVPCDTDAHDISLLPNGNVLMPVSATKIVEMSLRLFGTRFAPSSCLLIMLSRGQEDGRDRR